MPCLCTLCTTPHFHPTTTATQTAWSHCYNMRIPYVVVWAMQYVSDWVACQNSNYSTVVEEVVVAGGFSLSVGTWKSPWDWLNIRSIQYREWVPTLYYLLRHPCMYMMGWGRRHSVDTLFNCCQSGNWLAAYNKNMGPKKMGTFPGASLCAT